MIRALILGLTLMLSGQMAISPARGGVASAFTPPLIRCSSSISTSSAVSSIAIPICSGAQAGDFTLLFCDSAFSITNISTWTSIINHGGNTWNNITESKLLSSGDISTGTVTCTAGGSFDMAGGMVSFIGATSGVREFQTTGFQSAPPPITLTSSGGVLASDIAVYWTSGRLSLPSTAIIIPGGGGPLVTLNTESTTNSYSLLADQTPAGGVQANAYSWTVSANFDAIQLFVTP